MGASHQALENEEAAMNAYKTAIELGLFPTDRAKAYNNMGAIYRHQGQLSKSAEYHNLSLQLKSSQDPELVATHINLALAYMDMQDEANSFVHCQKALDAITILPVDNSRIGMVHFTLGTIKAKMKQHLAAVDHFSNALTAYRQMTISLLVTQSIIKTLYEQDLSYIELDETTRALTAFNEILWLASTNDDLQDQLALAYHSIGHIYDLQGALRRALQAYMTSLNIWMNLLKRKLNIDRHVLAQLYNDIGEIHDKRKHYAFALWYYTQAIQFAEGDSILVQEYQENFKFAAIGALHVLRKNLNVHIIEFDLEGVLEACDTDS